MTPTSNAKTFMGDIEELQGSIYDCANTSDADRYLKTTTKIQEYVGRTLILGELLSPALENPSAGIPVLAPPTPNYADPAVPTAIETMIMGEEIKLHVKQKVAMQENNRKLYSILRGQCTDLMLSRVEGHANYPAIKTARNGLGLLEIIPICSYQALASHQLPPHTIHKAMVRFYNFKQKKNQ
jgi:hypothetical protein